MCNQRCVDKVRPAVGNLLELLNGVHHRRDGGLHEIVIARQTISGIQDQNRAC